MRVRSTFMISAAAIALSSFPANAQPAGWYVEGAGGVNWVEDMDLILREDGDPDEDIGFASFDTGWAASARVGYGFGNGLRIDGEVVYRDNGIDEFIYDGTTFHDPLAQGDISSWGFMLNALYDIQTGTAFTPYVGLGVGAAIVDVDGSFLGQSFSEDDTGFAAQGIAGVSYAFTPNLSVLLDYRYFRAFDLSFELTEPTGGQFLFMEDDYVSHTVMAGLRYTFVPPPPPPPEPVIAPLAETAFIVFFDWDRADLTPEANLVLDDVVVAANQTGAASVRLDGYTDLSGSAAYNLGLSERRANSVADGLIARGIAPDEIVVRAFGEENPLVPTPDGVREPQNRRVEIFLT
jgi:opacity protein-like surface antigen